MSNLRRLGQFRSVTGKRLEDRIKPSEMPFACSADGMTHPEDLGRSESLNRTIAVRGVTALNVADDLAIRRLCVETSDSNRDTS